MNNNIPGNQASSRTESNQSHFLPNAGIKRHAVSTLDTALVALIKWLLCPVVVVLSLVACAKIFGQDFVEDFLPLAVVSFLLASHIFDEANLYRQEPEFPLRISFEDILTKWAVLVACLLGLAWISNTMNQFPRNPVLAWFVLTPFMLLLSKWLARKMLVTMATQGKQQRNAIIVGANDIGHELYTKLEQDAYLGIKVLGFFDDRAHVRLPSATQKMIEGVLDDVPNYISEKNVHLVYISLPTLPPHPRVITLLDQLRDSTASVYLVPDMYIFDLINPHFDHVNGVPVISIRDTPYFGIHGLIKRLSDIVISFLILVLISPVLAIIAVGVKLSSPGPILFRQRRYGLYGEEIKVWKFRSMTVTEDGDHVVQAKKDDQRITRFGKFLRKTSLDELPQFVNVFVGSMSVVGPRPHAVAHNELYRKIITNYMIRHKVKPGITGLAQVNGLRGETDTKDKMEARINYDLQYIRNWSLMVDLFIILKTIKVVFVHDKNAF